MNSVTYEESESCVESLNLPYVNTVPLSLLKFRGVTARSLGFGNNLKAEVTTQVI